MKLLLILCCGSLISLTPWSAAQPTKPEPAPKRFEGTISASAESGVMNVRIRIPKANQKTPLQAVYLDRRSATGLDLHVPVSFREKGDAYEIYLLLPFEFSGKVHLNCVHAAEPPKDGSRMSGVAAGPTYEIPLQPNTPN